MTILCRCRWLLNSDLCACRRNVCVVLSDVQARKGELDPESPTGGPRSFKLQAPHPIEAAATGSEDQGDAREQQDRPDRSLSCHYHGHFDGHWWRCSHPIHFRFKSPCFLAIYRSQPFPRILQVQLARKQLCLLHLRVPITMAAHLRWFISIQRNFSCTLFSGYPHTIYIRHNRCSVIFCFHVLTVEKSLTW